MSGGSLNYVSYKVEDAACEVLRRAETPLHRAFANHLTKVAKALHDIEWMFSCDTSPGDEEEAIRACLTEGAELQAAIDAATKARDDLNALIERSTKA